MKRLLTVLSLNMALLGTQPASAQIKLAPVFGDHIMLQREMPVSIWGGAEPGTKLTVEFAGQSKEATADKDGRWLAKLAPMEASAEGRVLKVGARKIRDVLVGEVWLGSGQSNMQWDFGMLGGLHEKARKVADNPLIRY